MSQMFQLFEQASCVIGYNIIGFDLPVLQAYYPGDIMQFPAFDILDDIRETLGRRLALNDVVAATLGKKKSGNGLQAIEYFREGKIEELRQYCLDDTMLTKQLFDYGVENNEIYYMSERGKTPIRVRWKKHMDRPASEATHLILPF
jgi:DEAD/DEAH box helicase domain-containing protein